MSRPAGGRPPSATRTIRLPEAVDSALKRRAADRKMSPNSFISSILQEHEEWHAFAARFGFISVPASLFGMLLDELSDARLAVVGREAGRRLPKEIIEFWFKSLTAETFVEYLRLASAYQKIATYEVVVGGPNAVVVAHHEHNRKWSIWIENYVGEAIRSALGVEPKVEAEDNTVKFEFTLQQRPPAGQHL